MKIFYSDLLPGVGKTSWAAEKLAKVVFDKTAIVLYTAPTHLLLRETRKAILRLLPVELHHHVIHLKHKHDKCEFATVQSTLLALVAGDFRTPKGTIILCSHSAFLALPHRSKDPSWVRSCSRVSVVFDEARKCVLSETTVHLPRAVVRTLTSQSEELAFYQKASLLNKAAVLEAHPKLSKENRWALSKLYRVTNKGPHVAIDAYTRTAMKGVRYTDVSVASVLDPASLFANFSKVVLLGSFLKHSQMYHRLKEAKRQGLDVSLTDISKQVVTADRVASVRARYSAMTIAYLSERTLTSNVVKAGVVMSSQVLNKDYYEQLAVKVKAVNTDQLPFNRLVRGAFENQQHLDALGDAVNKYSKYTPLAFYTRAAYKVFQSWVPGDPADAGSLLVSTNVGAVNAEGVPKYWVDQVEPVMPPSTVERVPFSCHGLNKYQHKHALAFLAALAPNPTTARLLHQLCPEYDSHVDYVVAQAIQTAARISVRDVEICDPTLVIVPSKKLAMSMQTHLNDWPHVVDARVITDLPDVVALYLSGRDISSAQSKAARRETTQAYRKRYLVNNKDKLEYLEFRTGDMSKELARLRARQRYKPSVKLAKQIKKLAEALVVFRRRVRVEYHESPDLVGLAEHRRHLAARLATPPIDKKTLLLYRMRNTSVSGDVGRVQNKLKTAVRNNRKAEVARLRKDLEGLYAIRRAEFPDLKRRYLEEVHGR